MVAVQIELFGENIKQFFGMAPIAIKKIQENDYTNDASENIISVGESLISLKYFPKDNPFEYMLEFNHIEIFSLKNGKQIWATDCLKKLSAYTEDEWKSAPIETLYTRPLPIVKEIYQYVNKAILTGQTLRYKDMDHTVIESKTNREFQIQLGYVIPLYDIQMNPVAV